MFFILLNFKNVQIQTIVLSPTFAFPYFPKQLRPLQNARNHICRKSSLSSYNANSFAPLVKNKQYRAPEVPPICASAIFAISDNNVAGCEKDSSLKLFKIPRIMYNQ